uniref:Uncharacterized protein n=1 Tax=Anguilla anguilla TaxID=7936 RepID=A0A0E9PZM4_ANGAN
MYSKWITRNNLKIYFSPDEGRVRLQRVGPARLKLSCHVSIKAFNFTIRRALDSYLFATCYF